MMDTEQISDIMMEEEERRCWGIRETLMWSARICIIGKQPFVFVLWTMGSDTAIFDTQTMPLQSPLSL